MFSAHCRMAASGSMTALRTALFGLALVLAGCSDRPAQEPEAEDAGLLEPQRQALETARGVEDDLAEAARRQQEEIDDQSG